MTPLMRLQDPSYSKVVIVTLPETTPVAEHATCRTTSAAPGSSPTVGSSTPRVADSVHVRSGPRPRRVGLEQAQLGRIAGIASRSWTIPWDPAIAGQSRADRLLGAHPVAGLV